MAKASGRTTDQVRRQFLLQLFAARVFASPDNPWVLKGGAGLFSRLPATARFSRDVDLIHHEDLDLASEGARLTAELEAAVTATAGPDDPFTFRLRQDPQNPRRVLVTAYLDATQFDTFPIDLSNRSGSVSVEKVTPDPVLQIPGLPSLPAFSLYPIARQVADKICAMYERHGPQGTASTRYRDLVDLVIISDGCEVGAENASSALVVEAGRRRLTLPDTMTMPDERWRTGYASAATDARLDPLLRQIDRALAHVRPFIDPLLLDTASGSWNPDTRRWR